MTRCRPESNSEALRGLGKLAIDAVTGVTDIVEGMHRNIAGLAPPLGKPLPGPTSGITGMVYRSVRGITGMVGRGLDASLRAAEPWLGATQPAATRDALIAALNGVYGDHLERSANPLAIRMSLRRGNRVLPLRPDELQSALPELGAHPLILLHGLCMNPQQWCREGHDHGAELERTHGYTALYLHYNSGRSVAANGRELASLLQQLQQVWPRPLESISLLGHSMGGLVARSAVAQAQAERMAWTDTLRTLSFLGTPHHGAALERAGSWIDALIGASPYSAPLARLGTSRSAGIQDLRFGQVLEQPRRRRDTRTPLRLPDGVRCHAVAATRAAPAPHSRKLPGDGLVAIPSALGQHRKPELDLQIPPEHQLLVHRCGHFDLLNHPEVYRQLEQWLAMQ